MALISDAFATWASRPYQDGRGLHVDLFTACIGLLERGHSEDVVFRFVREAADKVTERTVPDREILSAIAYAKIRLLDPEKKASNRWPSLDPAYRAEVVNRGGFALDALCNNAARLPQDTATWLRTIYAETDLVCAGFTGTSFLTRPRDEVAEMSLRHVFEYVNPSPMSARNGLTGEGVLSEHCLKNCGPKVWQVVEFDTGQSHEHSAILWHLAHRLPLRIVVYSGGKSVHGWFDVKDVSEDVVHEFFAEAVMLGADPKMWSVCQFSRMPGGTNPKTGRRQEVLIYEPK